LPNRDRHPAILVITGLSGSGKTYVLRALEDVGWFCVDNLPVALIPPFAELIHGHDELRRSALVVDMRASDFLGRFPTVHKELRRRGVAVGLLFLEADEKTLVRRFSETRRPHPLAINQPVLDGIREERDALRTIRTLADTILDTSGLTVHQLRDWVREHYDVRAEAPPLVISVMSFGYKYGVPAEADLVFDVRFLPNPNFVPSLKKLTGKDARVVRYVRRGPDADLFLKKIDSLLAFVVPRYIREGKSYLTIAIGCTGGRHRSVMMARALGALLAKRGLPVNIRHRDVKLT
jgi:RNase adapter protein RapZ